MTLQIVTPPTAQAIDLADAKLHLRVTIPTDDLLIGAWIDAATDYAENLTHKQMVAARWKQSLDSFPGQFVSSAPYGKAYARPGNAIYLERGPVQQVVSIQYLDTQSVLQTVPASTYVVDYTSDPVRITPVFGQIWPIPVPQIGAVWVIFDTGFAAPITASGNNVTVQGWIPLVIGNVVRFTNSGGALPAPLLPKTDYFIQSVPSVGVYTLSATSGGALLPLTTAGTGTSYLSGVPEGIRAWMKLRLASMYENREELDAGGLIMALPYVDRLLDGFRTYEF